jgi:hypothetical protein
MSEIIINIYAIVWLLIFFILAIKFRVKHSGRKLDLIENIMVSGLWPFLIVGAVLHYTELMYDKFTRRK